MQDREDFKSKFLLSDDEIIKLGVSKILVEEYRRKHYQESFALETWYHQKILKDFSFPTTIIDLSFEEAKELIKCHLRDCNSLEKEKIVNDSIIMNLEERIQKEIKKNYSKMGCFIKLNTRSPKDCLSKFVDSPKVLKNVDDEFAKEIFKSKKHTANDLLFAYIKAMNKSMRMDNAKEIISVLIKSQRVFDDLNKQTKFGKKLYNCKLIFRMWNEEVIDQPDLEFRCFVHNNKLTAITQYFTYYYSKQVNDKFNQIEKRIKLFFEKIKKFFEHHNSYVIDFFVGKENIYIIEINPFHVDAGPCLFNWSKDSSILMNGPCEFRIVKEYPTLNIVNIFSFHWKKYLFKKFGIKEFEKFVVKDSQKSKKEKKGCTIQ